MRRVMPSVSPSPEVDDEIKQVWQQACHAIFPFQGMTSPDLGPRVWEGPLPRPPGQFRWLGSFRRLMNFLGRGDPSLRSAGPTHA